jgi:hypothetical protein
MVEVFMDWKLMENEVKRIASCLWCCIAVSETIAGIKCDCVVKKDHDSWYLLEATTEKDLAKLREDIIKLNTMKNALFVDNIFAKCYFIMEDKPTDSLRESGKSQHVEVYSLEEFRRLYFDYSNYKYLRGLKQFGSLIDIESGKPEDLEYVSVNYLNKKTGEKVNIGKIIEMLMLKKCVILKGNFGTGKSRCVKQVFDILSQNASENLNYPIAINLREHWGAKHAIEIVERHFRDLGIDPLNFIKTYNNDNIIYLLDGFDEIGTQSWSDDPKKMRRIRETSVVAIKNMVQNIRGGMLITGREHYFNTDKEMLDCLGANAAETIILECNDEFSTTEFLELLDKQYGGKVPDGLMLPDWMPKRPLVMQIIIKCAHELFFGNSEMGDVYEFWHLFIEKLCEREARISPALSSDRIRSILVQLGRLCRTKARDIGPITITELSNAFETVNGFPPNDESSIMLQRLPGLGRVDADSPDRQFIDTFILNGLRAEDVINSVNNNDRLLLDLKWVNPIDRYGCSIISEYLQKDGKHANLFLGFAKQASQKNNHVLASDLMSSLLMCQSDEIDFKNLNIDDSYFSCLLFNDKKVSNFKITNSSIYIIDITNAGFLPTTEITSCVITNIVGIPSERGLPTQIRNNGIENYQTISTTSRIKQAKLKPSQQIFVTIIKKIFFQPGSGRKEEALFRGLGEAADRKIAEKIINKLIDEDIIHKIRGNEGFVYTPVRGCTGRLDKILSQLTQCTDPLWEYVTAL